MQVPDNLLRNGLELGEDPQQVLLVCFGIIVERHRYYQHGSCIQVDVIDLELTDSGFKQFTSTVTDGIYGAWACRVSFANGG